MATQPALAGLARLVSPAQLPHQYRTREPEGWVGGPSATTAVITTHCAPGVLKGSARGQSSIDMLRGPRAMDLWM
jgi:hypothetical protein